MSAVNYNAGSPGSNDSSSKRPGPAILRAVKDTVKDASERVLSAVVENDEETRGEADEDEDAVPISSSFARLITSPKAPEKMNGGGGGGAIESAAVGGIAAGSHESHDDAEQSQSQSQTLRDLLGSCGTDLMPGRDGSGGSRRSLRMPSRTESVEFVRNLLPERLGDVRDELNASVMRCVRSDGTGGGRGRGRGRGTGGRGRGGSSDRIGGSNNADASVDGSEDVTDSGGGGASIASFRTLDTKEEQLEDEMHRLERMTSWNTLDTTGTSRTYSTAGTYSTMQNGGRKADVRTLDMLGLDDGDAPASKVIRDDDGNEIPDVLKDLKSRRERGTRSGRNSKNNKSSRRKKKAVQFDYPPISSLRECPRTDPKDRAGLFFTEEELDEIETDRASCRMVDDVEVVAVPAVTLPTSSTSKGDEGNKKMSKREARKMSLGASRKKKDPVRSPSSSCADQTKSLSLGSVSASRQGVGSGSFLSRRRRSDLSGKRPGTPLPNDYPTYSEHNEAEDGSAMDGRGRKESGVAENSKAKVGVHSTADGTSSRTDAAEEEKSGPLLKGVQIYLRQRSTNETRKKG